MIRFFDASALAKRYVKAGATSEVNRWLRSAEHAAVSRLTEAELSSAFARRVREGSMSRRAREAALTRVRADLERLHVVELVPPVIARVHALLERHPLRAADALQLAGALAFAEHVRRPTELVVYDARLASAALAEGLRVLPG